MCSSQLSGPCQNEAMVGRVVMGSCTSAAFFSLPVTGRETKDLAPQHATRRLGDGGDDGVRYRLDLVLGQRLVARLHIDRDGDRLLAVADMLALIDGRKRWRR